MKPLSAVRRHWSWAASRSRSHASSVLEPLVDDNADEEDTSTVTELVPVLIESAIRRAYACKVASASKGAWSTAFDASIDAESLRR